MLGAYLAPAPNTTYGNILPIAQDNTTGALRLALPSALRSVGQGVLDLFDGPATGSMTPEATMALAALYGAGSPISSMGYEAPDEGGVVASRFVRSYNPPVKQPRPFEADYPNGASTDAEGNLVTDAEGRPLLGGYVAGRTVAGGADEAIPPAQYDQLAEALLGTRPAPVASRAIRGDSGRLVRTIDPQTGDNVYNIVFNKSLPPGVQDDTIAHELGHFIDILPQSRRTA